MISCENCGAENEDDINFCRVCGSRLSNQDENMSRIVKVVTPADDSEDETSFDDYKTFELKQINSFSFGKINYFLFVSLSLIFGIITVILTRISFINLPIYSSVENVLISSLIDILRTFLASLIIGIIVFVISCIFSWIYNKLSTKISGIKININKDNKLNKIHYSSLKIIMSISVIELLIMDALIFLISFNIDSNDFTLFTNVFTPIKINLMEFLKLLIGFDVIFLIFSLISAFLFMLLFNLISRKYPLKLDLKSNIVNNSYSISKIYIKSFIITVGIPLIILELLLCLINFTVIYVLGIVVIIIIYLIIVSWIYNLLSKKLGGYEINLEV